MTQLGRILLPGLRRSLKSQPSTSIRRLGNMAAAASGPVIPNQSPPIPPFASRLKTGRALALDVWSVFKYVSAFFSFELLIIANSML